MVSPEVVKRVLSAASTLRYHRNEAAVGLRTRKSWLINILVPDLSQPIYAAMVGGIRERLVNSRYVAIVGDEKRVIGQERYSLRAMKMRPIGGLIVATAQLRDKFVDEAVSEQVPLVQVLRATKKQCSPTVLVDFAQGVRAAVNILRAHGHVRIVLITHPANVSPAQAQKDGFKAAMADSSIDVVKEQWEAASDESIEAGRQAFLQLCRRFPKPTAVIAATDHLAIGAIDAAHSLGLSCPEQVSVVGFGDYPLVDRISPPLSTMKVDYARIGRLAADLIIRELTESRSSQIHNLVEPELVLRGSIGPLS